MEGQQKLRASRILVIGAGGLGCPVLLYLTAAGVGTLGIVDDDLVSITNLNRQILYVMDDLGLPKAEIAANHLRRINPEIQIQVHQTRLTTQNALEIMQPYDIIVDGTDNFPSRYLINDACILLGKPLVYGAVSGFEGQVAVFNVRGAGGGFSVNYRDIFPQPPKAGTISNCEEAGVLGMLPGTIGCLQAAEVIKLITGSGQVLINRVQTVNLLTGVWQTFELSASKSAKYDMPQNAKAFMETNYDLPCSSENASEISVAEFDAYLRQKNVGIFDIREAGEQPFVDEFEYISLPFSSRDTFEIDHQGDTWIFFCQTGSRSLKALQAVKIKYPNKSILSLRGGITAWKNAKIKINHE